MTDLKQFGEDVREGLSQSPKTLPSKYFYDQRGDELFVEIMHMPEYYLTRSEYEIFRNHSADLIEALNPDRQLGFDLIELGAGDGSKTIELLRELLRQKYDFDYIPIDISTNTLNVLSKRMKDELPDLNLNAKEGDYFRILEDLRNGNRPKVLLFLGSNIGNMTDDRAAGFLKRVSDVLHTGDTLLLGVDLIKSRNIVFPAYNDPAGLTRAFNLNLLSRINRELGGNFDLDSFEHRSEYTEEEGIAKSFLMSTCNQAVTISSIAKTFHFGEGERIHTEISRKYNDEVLNRILKDTALKVKGKLTDQEGYFADYILERV